MASPSADNTNDDATNPSLHRDVFQCLDSSFAVFYYTYVSKPPTLPINRREIPGMPSGLRTSSPAELLAMEDQELTYAIEANHSDKLLRLTFRGSMTSLDWLHDFNFRMVSVRNPLVLEDHKGKQQKQQLHHIRQTKCFGIHRGFRNYLFGGTQPAESSTARSPAAACWAPAQLGTDVSCKYDRILQKISEYRRIYPEYEIQITGHSMGGAMATLTAFLLAADGLGPVTCISLASPRVGNGNFVRAFAELECAGRIRHLRIVNSDDVVTALPDTTYMAMGLAAHLIRQNFYLHAGVCLHMNDKLEPGIFVPKIRREAHALYDWTHRGKNMGKRALTLYRLAAKSVPTMHNPNEYQKRLEHAEDFIRKTSWEGIYDQYIPKDSAKKRIEMMS